MYHRPPPRDAHTWPFGFLLTVCMEIGLGKPGGRDEKWSEDELRELLKLAPDTSSIRSWERGTNVGKKTFPKLLGILTREERYSDKWKSVLEESYENKRLNTREKIDKIRKSVTEKTNFQKNPEAKEEIKPYIYSLPTIEIKYLPELVTPEAERPTLKNHIPIIYKAALALAVLLLTFFSFNLMNSSTQQENNGKLNVADCSIDFKIYFDTDLRCEIK